LISILILIQKLLIKELKADLSFANFFNIEERAESSGNFNQWTSRQNQSMAQIGASKFEFEDEF
jgi:hypothetical protein